ncbi:MAG: hypothetical protein ACLRTR_05420 [Clostridia bacterium]|jgi:hypothetical protein
MKKESKALVNVEKNKDSNISITIGQVDELSCDNIRRNYDDVVTLENEFTERLEYSKDVLTKKLLPKQLQDDFEIVPKYIGDRVEYETKATTTEAYEKFPMKFTYTMTFKDKEEAKKFRENGLNELIEKAEELRKPIEIPNITSMKEFIGEFEDPVGYANKYGSEGIKLYICPSPLPKAQKYKIDIFNSFTSFNIETSLRLKGKYKDKVILTNKEAEDEPYDITISLIDMKKTDSDKQIKGKFNLTISLRNKFYNSCEYNKEIIKFKFLIEDANNHIIINNVDLDKRIFSFENCGNNKYIEKDYKRLENTLNLIDKVIYISKIRELTIDYNLGYFIQNEELINLLYNNSINKEYSINKKMIFNHEISKNTELEKIISKNQKFKLISQLHHVDLFGTRFELKANKLTMLDCSIISFNEEEDRYLIEFQSSHTKVEPLNNSIIKE